MYFSNKFLGLTFLSGKAAIKSAPVASLTNVIMGFTEHLMYNSQCIRAWLHNLLDSGVTVLLVF